MIVRRVGPLSLAKISGVLYAVMGLIFGAIVSLVSIVGGALTPDDGSGGMAGMVFGAAAIVILPIFYGAIGFIGSLIAAALYNAVASTVGGVELDLQ
jgi:hypothetical protein